MARACIDIMEIWAQCLMLHVDPSRLLSIKIFGQPYSGVLDGTDVCANQLSEEETKRQRELT